MFGVKAKREEFNRHSQSLKDKISELHWKIRTGELTPDQVKRAKALLEKLEAQNAGSRGDTERRVRKEPPPVAPTPPAPQPPATA